MNILGIDYGTKRIGLAWVQTGLDVVLPFGVMKNEKWKMEIEEIISKEKINKIIVGLPVGLDGKENENTERVEKFIDELKFIAKIPIETVDERFSSRAADRMEGGVSRDEKAAMVILQSYLEIKNSAE